MSKGEIGKRFWRNVSLDGSVPEHCPELGACWVWTTGCFASGYGEFWNGKQSLAHRVSWELSHGPIRDQLHVLHKCDNKKCVRPDHLFLGTRQDNMSNMAAKGRAMRGERHLAAKLSTIEVRIIRKLRAAGYPLARLAAVFGVAETSICALCKRRTWKHVA